MSQQGTIISATPFYEDSGWVVLFSFLRDDGTTGQAEAIVSNSGKILQTVRPFPATPTVPFWVSATSTIQVNAPGSSNPVVLGVPPIIRCAAFGLC